jgi:predicted dehydrogenase
MIELGLVGLGKMGISHFAIANAHPQTRVSVCDATGYVLDVVKKYTGVDTYADFDKLLERPNLDAVIIATPSRFHGPMVRAALERGVHVFCEKPFCLDWRESEELAQLAESKGLVNQVGYHYRYVGAFREMKRVLDSGAIGEVTHALAEAYGPVVLRPKGSTWRTQSAEGGGCLYDYAAHPINLLNWCFGSPASVSGTILNPIFSTDTDDEVYSTFSYPNGMSAHVSVNWSDESQRKMSTKLTLMGTKGRIYADRQECQVFLREESAALPGYEKGWTVKYTTELTEEVWFYLRGEEYSAQIDAFVRAVEVKKGDGLNSFRSAAETDRVMSRMIADSKGVSEDEARPVARQVTTAPRKRFSLFGR